MGTLPNHNSQNKFFSLPLLLLPEEVTLCLEKGMFFFLHFELFIVVLVLTLIIVVLMLILVIVLLVVMGLLVMSIVSRWLAI